MKRKVASVSALIPTGRKMFVDEKGDMYLLCTGAYGMNPKYKTGILRIKKGEKSLILPTVGYSTTKRLKGNREKRFG